MKSDDRLGKFELNDNPFHNLNYLMSNERSAVAISSEYVQSSMLMKTSSVYCLPPSAAIYGYHLKFLVRENFELLNKLNKFILTVGQSGLISKWKNDVRARYIHYDLIEDTQITYENLILLHIIWCVMITMAIVAFITEKIVHRQRIKSNPKMFWIYAEMLIDSKRYYLLDKVN